MHAFFCHNLAKVTNFENLRNNVKGEQSLELTLWSFQIEICGLSCAAHCKVPFRSRVLSMRVTSTESRFELPLSFQWGPIFCLIMLLFQMLVGNLPRFPFLYDHFKTFSCLFLFQLPHPMWASPKKELCLVFLWI